VCPVDLYGGQLDFRLCVVNHMYDSYLPFATYCGRCRGDTEVGGAFTIICWDVQASDIDFQFTNKAGLCDSQPGQRTGTNLHICSSNEGGGVPG
jgi:hypothetical protein